MSNPRIITLEDNTVNVVKLEAREALAGASRLIKCRVVVEVPKLSLEELNGLGFAGAVLSAALTESGKVEEGEPNSAFLDFKRKWSALEVDVSSEEKDVPGVSFVADVANRVRVSVVEKVASLRLSLDTKLDPKAVGNLASMVGSEDCYITTKSNQLDLPLGDAMGDEAGAEATA